MSMIKDIEKLLIFMDKNGGYQRTSGGLYEFCGKIFKLPVRREYVYTCPYRDVERSVSMTKTLLAVPDRPSCILYPDDLAAVAGMNAIRKWDLEYQRIYLLPDMMVLVWLPL